MFEGLILADERDEEYYKTHPRPLLPQFQRKKQNHADRMAELNFVMLNRIEEAYAKAKGKDEGFLGMLKEREKILQQNRKTLQEEKYRLIKIIEAKLWELSKNDPVLRKAILDNAIKAKVIPPENIVAHKNIELSFLKDGTIRVTSNGENIETSARWKPESSEGE